MQLLWPIIYIVFILQSLYVIAKSLLDLICIYIYTVLFLLNLQISEKLWSQNILRYESGRNIEHLWS